VKTTPPSRKESTPRLPHEHDESHDSQATQPGPPRDDIKQAYKSTMNFGSGGGAKAKAWRDIWGAGQGVGLMDDVPAVAELVERLKAEYAAARKRLAL
jgi:NAD(P)H-dependent flavin oxidoreductase YrpB (nitropropane dioxygenase family)